MAYPDDAATPPPLLLDRQILPSSAPHFGLPRDDDEDTFFEDVPPIENPSSKTRP
jgi:hypothetical protein